MIRNETEYRESVQRLREQEKRLSEQRENLTQIGLTADQVARVTAPVQSFHQQLAEEVESYERLKRGEFDEICNLNGIGILLTAIRIYRGLSQRELAQRLGVHESQVSRDERNEYHNVTLERASRILDVLGVELTSHVEKVKELAAV